MCAIVLRTGHITSLVGSAIFGEKPLQRGFLFCVEFWARVGLTGRGNNGIVMVVLDIID